MIGDIGRLWLELPPVIRPLVLARLYKWARTKATPPTTPLGLLGVLARERIPLAVVRDALVEEVLDADPSLGDELPAAWARRACADDYVDMDDEWDRVFSSESEEDADDMRAIIRAKVTALYGADMSLESFLDLFCATSGLPTDALPVWAHGYLPSFRAYCARQLAGTPEADADAR